MNTTIAETARARPSLRETVTVDPGQHARLWGALAIFATMCLAFSLVNLAVGLMTSQPAMAALGGITLASAVVAYAALSFARSGRVDAAVDTVVASILATSVAWVAVMPELHDVVTLAPVLAVAVALPYRSGRSLVAILAVAMVAASAISVVAVSAPHPEVPDAYTAFVGLFGTLAITVMVLLGLWHFSTRLRTAVDGMTETVEVLRTRERAIAAVSNGIAIVDVRRPGWPIVFVNPAFERITGYAAADVLGTDGMQLVGPDTDPDTLAEHERTVLEGRDGRVTILNYRRDGSPFWNELSVAPILDETGRITHYVAVQVDVTARLALEERLRVAERMEAVGQLAGGIAHDFNNILTAISGYARIAREEVCELPASTARDAACEDLDEISRAADRAATLTRQLLAFSRRQVLRPEVVTLSQVVTELGPMLRRLIGERYRLETRLGAAVPPVLADPGQLEQVIVNLALNARDASPSGGRIIIETSAIEIPVQQADGTAPGRYVRLSVIDEGTGIPQEVQARMFEPFFTTKGRGQGTGLGLATVYGIVTQSGGRVRCLSRLTHGTTFEVDLPAHLGTTETPVPNRTRRFAEITGGEETILVAEDERSVRSLTATLLRRTGYHVLEAASGDEALELVRGHHGRIDVLLTDVVMPGMSGPELAGQVRAARSMPVVYMSGYPDEVRAEAGDGSTDPVLEKPFTQEALHLAIRTVLDERPVA